MIHIDFETRSELNIWEVGAWKYAAHPSTDILCMAYAVDDGPVKILDRDDVLLSLPMNILGRKLCAHNAFFEQAVWYHILHKRLNWPLPAIGQWHDSMALANAHALPASLEKCAEALNLSVQKDMSGKRVMQKMSKPRKPSKHDSSRWFEAPEDFETLHEYCRQDVIVERAIYKALRQLNKQERSVWVLDQCINHLGVPIDTDAVLSALYIIGEFEARLNAEVKEITDGHLDGVTYIGKILRYLAKHNIDIPDLTKATVAQVLRREDIPAHIRRLLEIRQQLGKISTKKYQSMLNSVGKDGRIRDTLMYHGASTGRWTGKLVQMQNIPRGNVKDTDQAIDIMKLGDVETFEMCYGPDVMGAISSCIRGMIYAPEGKTLYVADFAAIEARVLLWLADDRRGLKLYREGVDLYVDMARQIFNSENISKRQRQLGKTAILGCGYGMGSDKFFATCISWGQEVSKDLAKRAVETYRNTYSSVKRMWYAQEDAAIRCCRTRKNQTCGHVTWHISGSFLFCRLPSGRDLAYPFPRLQKIETPWGDIKDALTFMEINSITKQWVRNSTYGGKLTENITQAVARDLLAEAMIRLTSRNYPVILTVHDEIICETRENYGSLEEFISIMEEVPGWAQGCPVSAEGFKRRRYKK